MKGIGMLAGLLLMPLVLWAGEAMDAAQLRAGLERLHHQGWWGEMELAGGSTREVKVDSVAGDTVVVREILGALMEHPAVYTLSQIRSLRELGPQRIPLRRAVYSAPRSRPLALGLEVLVPGGGYFYAGQPRQGLVLLALAGVVVGAGLATGKSGAAGWVPLAAWVKVASLVNLNAELKGINTAAENRQQAGLLPGVQFSWSY